MQPFNQSIQYYKSPNIKPWQEVFLELASYVRNRVLHGRKKRGEQITSVACKLLLKPPKRFCFLLRFWSKGNAQPTRGEKNETIPSNPSHSSTQTNLHLLQIKPNPSVNHHSIRIEWICNHLIFLGTSTYMTYFYKVVIKLAHKKFESNNSIPPQFVVFR